MVAGPGRPRGSCAGGQGRKGGRPAVRRVSSAQRSADWTRRAANGRRAEGRSERPGRAPLLGGARSRGPAARASPASLFRSIGEHRKRQAGGGEGLAGCHSGPEEAGPIPARPLVLLEPRTGRPTNGSLRRGKRPATRRGPWAAPRGRAPLPPPSEPPPLTAGHRPRPPPAPGPAARGGEGGGRLLGAAPRWPEGPREGRGGEGASARPPSRRRRRSREWPRGAVGEPSGGCAAASPAVTPGLAGTSQRGAQEPGQRSAPSPAGSRRRAGEEPAPPPQGNSPGRPPAGSPAPGGQQSPGRRREEAFRLRTGSAAGEVRALPQRAALGERRRAGGPLRSAPACLAAQPSAEGPAAAAAAAPTAKRASPRSPKRPTSSRPASRRPRAEAAAAAAPGRAAEQGRAVVPPAGFSPTKGPRTRTSQGRRAPRPGPGWAGAAPGAGDGSPSGPPSRKGPRMACGVASRLRHPHPETFVNCSRQSSFKNWKEDSKRNGDAHRRASGQGTALDTSAFQPFGSTDLDFQLSTPTSTPEVAARTPIRSPRPQTRPRDPASAAGRSRTPPRPSSLPFWDEGTRKAGRQREGETPRKTERDTLRTSRSPRWRCLAGHLTLRSAAGLASAGCPQREIRARRTSRLLLAPRLSCPSIAPAGGLPSVEDRGLHQSGPGRARHPRPAPPDSPGVWVRWLLWVWREFVKEKPRRLNAPLMFAPGGGPQNHAAPQRMNPEPGRWTSASGIAPQLSVDEPLKGEPESAHHNPISLVNPPVLPEMGAEASLPSNVENKQEVVCQINHSLASSSYALVMLMASLARDDEMCTAPCTHRRTPGPRGQVFQSLFIENIPIPLLQSPSECEDILLGIAAALLFGPPTVTHGKLSSADVPCQTGTLPEATLTLNSRPLLGPSHPPPSRPRAASRLQVNGGGGRQACDGAPSPAVRAPLGRPSGPATASPPRPRLSAARLRSRRERSARCPSGAALLRSFPGGSARLFGLSPELLWRPQPGDPFGRPGDFPGHPVACCAAALAGEPSEAPPPPGEGPHPRAAKPRRRPLAGAAVPDPGGRVSAPRATGAGRTPVLACLPAPRPALPARAPQGARGPPSRGRGRRRPEGVARGERGERPALGPRRPPPPFLQRAAWGPEGKGSEGLSGPGGWGQGLPCFSRPPPGVAAGQASGPRCPPRAPGPTWGGDGLGGPSARPAVVERGSARRSCASGGAGARQRAPQSPSRGGRRAPEKASGPPATFCGRPGLGAQPRRLPLALGPQPPFSGYFEDVSEWMVFFGHLSPGKPTTWAAVGRRVGEPAPSAQPFPAGLWRRSPGGPGRARAGWSWGAPGLSFAGRYELASGEPSRSASEEGV
uniref:collagen alpha-1(I) chain-like n=1 Tax=Euleptes europaea TaxID=460621 RepID=UPI00254024B1|nr:collagen alpha-1(I) chain-like [Euleptes europaea]